MAVTILGLGPGAWDQVTVQAQHALQQARAIHLRTARHPTVAQLPRHLEIASFDELYMRAATFEEVYRSIVDRVVLLGRRPEGVLYAVPGHPLVGEATVRGIIERCQAESVPYQIIPGLSFLEPALTALCLDPLAAGLQIVDALAPRLEPDRPALIGQVYDRRTASELKLALLELYPPDHPVSVVTGAGMPDERVRTVELAKLDHDDGMDHLTCLYLPALPVGENMATYQGLRDIVARLRAPDGCPWDRQQTHASLKPHILEETYEVLDALESGDPDKLAEEMGDLLMNLLMQVQIATEAGEFTEHDMFRSICEKLVRRHPHVFGTVKAETAEEVLNNWEVIKNSERAAEESALQGIPKAMPALAVARTMLAKASRLKVDLGEMDGANPVETLAAALAAAPDSGREAALGQLLLGLVEVGRRWDLDPEEALRAANGRFIERFQRVEAAARKQGIGVQELDAATRRAAWQRDQTD